MRLIIIPFLIIAIIVGIFFAEDIIGEFSLPGLNFNLRGIQSNDELSVDEYIY